MMSSVLSLSSGHGMQLLLLFGESPEDKRKGWKWSGIHRSYSLHVKWNKYWLTEALLYSSQSFCLTRNYFFLGGWGLFFPQECSLNKWKGCGSNTMIITSVQLCALTCLKLGVAVIISTELKVNGQKLETVTNFKYLGSVITDEGSKPKILSRIAQTTAVLTRLKPVWNDRSTSLSSKEWLMCSLVTSIFLYACEPWTLTAKLQRRIQTMEMRCYCKIPHILYKDHVTNKEVRAKIQQAIGPHEDLLTIIKRCKLQWYGHVSRSSGLAKTILQGTVKGGRRQGRQRKRWEDNIREWTGLEFGKSQRAVQNMEKWWKLVAKSSVVPQQPLWLRNRWEEDDVIIQMCSSGCCLHSISSPIPEHTSKDLKWNPYITNITRKDSSVRLDSLARMFIAAPPNVSTMVTWH